MQLRKKKDSEVISIIKFNIQVILKIKLVTCVFIMKELLFSPQVGIFRKPGVRSRIQKLRELHENDEDVQYDTFGPCDIADMVKTYFRELPEVLLTNKLSEIFITICQCKLNVFFFNFIVLISIFPLMELLSIFCC